MNLKNKEIDQARVTVREIKEVLDRAKIDIPYVLHGTEATTWAIMNDARVLGYGIRVGFEDTLTLVDGTVARSNAELVQEAIANVARSS